ncbi:MAG: glycosyltransferase [Phycisphaerae bacterium]
MAKKKILHIVGGEASVWVSGQLASQYHLWPEELFDQTIAAGEEPVARQVENRVFRPVVRLGRRLKIEYTAARNLSKLLRNNDPDLVLCWDIQATEQLKLAQRGSRKQVAAAVMLFNSGINQEFLFKLKSNYRHLDLHVICGSERLGRWASQELSAQERVHCVYPVFEKPSETIDKESLRRQMGFEPGTVLVFVPTEGKINDNYLALLGCGINERVNPKIRIILAGNDEPRMEQCRNFALKTIVPRILHIARDWDVHQVIGACDLVIQPAGGYSETLALVEAMGRSVPVISTAFAEPAELFRPNETFWNMGKVTGRAAGIGIYKMLGDEALRQTLIANARELVRQKCGGSEYRARLVKLYQQILNPRMELEKSFL